ncbi:MAG: hypothetical protein IC227_04045 [Enterococcus lacertideformus]|uniref:Uncharacterized protein n=1 Tax=Enterococcus lacertideformus TaxID=2771493 RepID=A0A931FAR0_9ENTE|nr:hypothetical protein [Enterococcus lacertideformus]
MDYSYKITGENTGINYSSGSGRAIIGQGDGLRIIRTFSGINELDKSLYIQASWRDVESNSTFPSGTTVANGKALVDTSSIF